MISRTRSFLTLQKDPRQRCTAHRLGRKSHMFHSLRRAVGGLFPAGDVERANAEPVEVELAHSPLRPILRTSRGVTLPSRACARRTRAPRRTRNPSSTPPPITSPLRSQRRLLLATATVATRFRRAPPISSGCPSRPHARHHARAPSQAGLGGKECRISARTSPLERGGDAETHLIVDTFHVTCLVQRCSKL
jgi:hypothetical protein